MEHAGRVVGRRGGAAPGVALLGREGRAVVHFGRGQAELQVGRFHHVQLAAYLGLGHFALHVTVLEYRTGHLLRGAGVVGADDRQDREVLAEVGRGVTAAEAGGAQGVARAERAVRLRDGGRLVHVEVQAQAVGHFPRGVEAEGIVLRLGGEVGAAHGDVAVRGRNQFLVDQRCGDRTVGPAAGRRAEVEPGRQVAAAGLDLVFGVVVVERGGQGLGRGELQGQCAVGALALHAAHAVVQVLRDRIHIGRSWTVGDRWRAHGAWLGNRAPVVFIAAERAFPAVRDRRLVVAQVAFLVAGRQGDTETLVGRGIGVDARNFRGGGAHAAADIVRHVLGRGVVHALDADAGMHAGAAQGTRRHHVDGGANAARWRFGAARFVDLDLGNRFRGQVGEVEGAAVQVAQVGGGHLAAIEQHQVEVGTDAAHGDLGTFTDRTVDRDARDALQRLGQVGIGELADVFRDDAVDDTVRILLQVHRGNQTLAQARHDHGLHFIGRDGGGARLLGEGWHGDGRAGAGDGQADQLLFCLRVLHLVSSVFIDFFCCYICCCQALRTPPPSPLYCLLPHLY